MTRPDPRQGAGTENSGSVAAFIFALCLLAFVVAMLGVAAFQ